MYGEQIVYCREVVHSSECPLSEVLNTAASHILCQIRQWGAAQCLYLTKAEGEM